jgi:hypothetical protein
MTDKTLRALAKDYANGVLDKEAYRKARDTLLKGILSGEISLVANDFRAPLQAQDLNSTFEKTSIQVAPPPPKEPKPTIEFVPPQISEEILESQTRKSSSKLYIVLGIVIGVIAVLVLAFIFSGSDAPVLLATDSNTEVPGEQPVQEPQEDNVTAAELVEDFLNGHDWSGEQLQLFVSRWNNLPEDELTKGLTPPLSIQLANAIYKQLLEERSLFGTANNDTIIARQQILVDFARALGMDDPRLQVREPPPALSVNESEADQAAPDTAPASMGNEVQ